MGKLVRDRIPERLAADGIEVTTVELSGAELVAALRDQVLEEAAEVVAASTRESLVEELADLREVLDSLADASGISEQEVRDRAAANRLTHGGFTRGLYSTSFPG